MYAELMKYWKKLCGRYRYKLISYAKYLVEREEKQIAEMKKAAGL